MNVFYEEDGSFKVALVMAEVFRALPCPPAVILVNNRKLAEGFFLGLGAILLAASSRLRHVERFFVALHRRAVDHCLCFRGIGKSRKQYGN